MKQSLLTLIMIFSISFGLAQDKNATVVLELFTSQGCSSCPSADKLVKELNSKDSNVIALSYHVDYWNYIGWKDPFSAASFTEKQREYANKFFSNSIYTPQLVVNGQEHFVGSDRVKLKEKVQKYKKQEFDNSISIGTVSNNNNTINFTYEVEGNTNKKWLTVNLLIKDRVTKVTRGENRSRTLENASIVVNQQTVALNQQGEGSLDIPDVVDSDDELILVLFTQDSKLNITGAVQKSL